MKRVLCLAVALLLLWAGSLWSATGSNTDAGICFFDPDDPFAHGVSPNRVEYYAMHWDSLSAAPTTWHEKDSARVSKVCYSDPIAAPHEMWLGIFAVHSVWYESDSIMAGGNVGNGGDTLVGDSDSLITTLQTSVDGTVWEDIFTWAGQADTSTLYLCVEQDSLDSYRAGQFFKLKWTYSAWADTAASAADLGTHLTDNKVLVLWQFEGGYKIREGVKSQ